MNSSEETERTKELPDLYFLKPAENAFRFWDNPDDAVYDEMKDFPS